MPGVYLVCWASAAGSAEMADPGEATPSLSCHGVTMLTLLLNLALGGEYPRWYNNTTEPYYGLPLSTLDLVKDNKIQVEVDWVRVYEGS